MKLFTTLLIASLMTVNANASVLGSVGKLFSGKVPSNSIKAQRIVTKINAKKSPLDLMKKIEFYEADDDLSKVVLKTIDEKVDEAQTRVNSAAYQVEEYFGKGNIFDTSFKAVNRANLGAIQIVLHNHTLIREMSRAERANYLEQHKAMVKKLYEAQESIDLDPSIYKTYSAKEIIHVIYEHRNVLNQVMFESLTLK